MSNHRRFEIVGLCVLLVAAYSGCRICGDRLQSPRIFKPVHVARCSDWWLRSGSAGNRFIADFESAQCQASINSSAQTSIDLGEDAFTLAERLHAMGDDRSVDYWARTIAWTEDGLQRGGGCSCQTIHENPCKHCVERVWRASRFRQSAMVRILSCGQGYGRLDPSSHLLINGSTGTFRVPIFYEGFAWNPDDFGRLLVFKPPTDSPGNICGRGIPLVVVTPKASCGSQQQPAQASASATSGNQCAIESFVKPETPFAATALLNIPVSQFDGSGELGNSGTASLTFVNPLAVAPISGSQGISQSPAMALAYARQISEYKPIEAFVNGDNGVDQAQLRFLEPYQPDKIPLILVHGLISDPATFLEMADVVRADPVLRTRYQIWVFRYPTGNEFLESAAILRQQLGRAFAYRNTSANPIEMAEGHVPTQRAVIVGHSLGGLVSKLQITDSGNELWSSIARLPLEQLRGPPDDIAEFRDSFYFRANPNISRIIYIATPHLGSPWASRGIGRFASRLAGKRSTEENDFETIAADNPGVFTGQFADSLPSSVDLLRPDSQLLLAIASTNTSPCVAVHSIIGESCRLPRAGPSDVVVPVDSAFRAEAESTAIIDATHTSILRSSDAEQEFVRLLRLHLERPDTVRLH